MKATFTEALDRLAGMSHPVAAIRAGWDLMSVLSSSSTTRSADGAVWALTRRPEYRHDYLYRAFALLALGKIHTDSASMALVDALQAEGFPTHAYAAAGLYHRVTPAAVLPLVRLLTSNDDLSRGLAQRALMNAPAVLSDSVVQRILPAVHDAPWPVRVSAIECLSREPASSETTSLFRRLAASMSEHQEVRSAAIRALGDMRDADAVAILEPAAYAEFGLSVQLAAIESLGEVNASRSLHVLLDIAALPGNSTLVRDAVSISLRRLGRLTASATEGLVVAQVSMHGTADPSLRSVGAGDNGGLATLTAGLGRALARHPQVERLYTVGRARLEGRSDEPEYLPDVPLGSHVVVQLPIAPTLSASAADMWASTFQIERGLERVFSTQPPLDAIHLRFADAGSWAASRWARRRGVRIVFTLAPDPYVPMQVAVQAGTLTRETFADVDRQQRLLARSGVLEWMSRRADRLALLPRPSWKQDAKAFFGVDLTFATERARVIAEGIDVAETERSRLRLDVQRPAVSAFLHRALSPGWGAGLAPNRRSLPMLVSIGRLNPIKGMERLVDVWARAEDLHGHFNLMIVGGDLRNPTVTENVVLNEITATMTQCPQAAGGLLMPGNLPHHEVSVLLAALHDGIPDLTQPHAIYVCASEKEEFGLAILEAMAAQLLVVAPIHGGPSTYLDDGRAGFLVDTREPRSLADGIRRAATVRADGPVRDRMEASLRNIVLERYSVDRMAHDLVAIYERTPGDAARSAS